MSIDHGNGAVKAISSEGVSLVLPSGYCLVDDLGVDGWEGVSNDLDVKTFVSSKDKGEIYCWGKDVTQAATITSTYTKENRYNQFSFQILSEFILASLLPDDVTNAEVLLVTGCPSAEKGTVLEEQLIDVFNGGHVVEVNGVSKMINVKQTYVLPQPLGTVLSLYMDSDGYVADRDYETDYIGVIDLGSGTTDIDGIRAMKRQRDDSDTIQTGIHEVYQQIADYINNENPSAKATRSSVEKQIIENEDPNMYVISKRASIDIEEEKERILKRVARTIINQINGRWTNRLKFDKIIVTGGGAMLLGKYLTEWEKDIIIVDDSQLANARGFYRYGLSRMIADKIEVE